MLSGKKSDNDQWSEGPSVFGGPVRPHAPHPLRAGRARSRPIVALVTWRHMTGTLQWVTWPTSHCRLSIVATTWRRWRAIARQVATTNGEHGLQISNDRGYDTDKDKTDVVVRFCQMRTCLMHGGLLRG
jgi:hypothetical protein